MKTIEVVLQNKHFKDADFTSNDDCPLARAIRQKLKINRNKIIVGPTSVIIDGREWEIIHGFYDTQYDRLKTKIQEGKTIKVHKELAPY